MTELSGLGRFLVFAGLGLALLGGLLWLGSRSFGLGRLPGDIVVRRGNFTFYFPLATSILVSLVLSLLFWLLRRR